MSPTTRHRHSLSKPALARRRKDRVPCPAPADHSEAIFFPRRCTFARRKSPSRHMRPSGHDNGLPLCDVALFQTAAIANSLANKPAVSREALQLKAASRAASLRSQVGSGRSVRSSTREAYEALTWRNKYRQQPESPGQQPSPCCTSCFTKETPKWREGPFGSHTLCNVCGLLYAKRQTRHRSVLVERELSGMAQIC